MSFGRDGREPSCHRPRVRRRQVSQSFLDLPGCHHQLRPSRGFQLRDHGKTKREMKIPCAPDCDCATLQGHYRGALCTSNRTMIAEDVVPADRSVGVRASNACCARVESRGLYHRDFRNNPGRMRVGFLKNVCEDTIVKVTSDWFPQGDASVKCWGDNRCGREPCVRHSGETMSGLCSDAASSDVWYR